MLNLTRKTDYALVALARLAEAGTSQDNTVSVRQIAEDYSLPLPILMNVLKDLHQAGLVRSTRGAHGGYYLSDTPEHIQLTSVIDAIEGPVQLTICCEEEEAGEPCLSCTLVERCPVTVGIRKLNERITEFLKQVTIKDLMNCDVDLIMPSVSTGTSDQLEPVALEGNHNDRH